MGKTFSPPPPPSIAPSLSDRNVSISIQILSIISHLQKHSQKTKVAILVSHKVKFWGGEKGIMGQREHFMLIKESMH